MATTETDWAQLRSALRGTLALPDDDGYDAAQPWNRAVQVRPAAVVSVGSAADVAQVIRWAGAHGLQVAVQNTGHGAVPVDESAILLDLTPLREVRIDAAARTATIGAGCQWSDVITAAAEHGLAPVAGSAPGNGVIGYLTGGGIGPLVHTFGVSSDRVRSFEVVTGDGDERHVTAQDTDLFWGLRGGKGTLGVVTSVELDLIELSEFYGGCVYFAADDAGTVLHAWRAWAEQLPDQATTSACIIQFPPDAGPPPLSGKASVGVRFAWVGDADDGARHADTIRSAAQVTFGEYGVLPATRIGEVHSDATDPMPSREEGYLLADLTDEAIDAFITAVAPGSGEPLVLSELRRLGGRFARPGDNGPDAFEGRHAQWNLMMAGVPVPDPQPLDTAVRRVMDALEPWSLGLSMPNFVSSNDPAQSGRFWKPDTAAWLGELANRFDPAHVLFSRQVPRPG